jgi:hypothetical protein
VYQHSYGKPDFTQSRYAGLKDAYYVRAHQQSDYIIEHDGHRFTAKCRASLTWTHGTDQAGMPMTDGTCTYMADKIGKSIGDDLMREEDNTLVFSPWTGIDTLQTADFLTITNDEPMK